MLAWGSVAWSMVHKLPVFRLLFIKDFLNTTDGPKEHLFTWLISACFFFKSLFIYFERAHKQGRGRERGRESQAGPELAARKPHAGLDSVNHEIET